MKKFEKPEVTIIKLDNSDIITTSGGTDTGCNSNHSSHSCTPPPTPWWHWFPWWHW